MFVFRPKTNGNEAPGAEVALVAAGAQIWDNAGMTKETQLTRGLKRRLMYVENKDRDIDGARARVGWVSFSKTGKTVYYRGRELAKANGIRGNFLDVVTRNEYWVSGIKQRGSNVHWSEGGVSVVVDADALDEYERQKSP